ncbi:hypothetical protein DFH09DRAFT_1282105 [Mycena vulgaris]|nr:hypothetical protein DFH09DRAFT_1282105 [Mycena vulgaris]
MGAVNQKGVGGRWLAGILELARDLGGKGERARAQKPIQQRRPGKSMSYLGVGKHSLRVRGASACSSSSARIAASDVESKFAVFELGGGGVLGSVLEGMGCRRRERRPNTRKEKRVEPRTASTQRTRREGSPDGKGNGREHGWGVGTGRHRRREPGGEKTDGMEERAKGGKGAPAAGVVECMCGTPTQATGHRGVERMDEEGRGAEMESTRKNLMEERYSQLNRNS